MMVVMSEMYSFGPQLKLQSMGKFSVSPNRNTAWHNQDALKVMHVMFFTWRKLRLCVTYYHPYWQWCYLVMCDLPWIRNSLTARTWCYFPPGQCSTALSLWLPKLTAGLLFSCVYPHVITDWLQTWRRNFRDTSLNLQMPSTRPSCIIIPSVLVVTACLTDGRGMMSLVIV